MKVFSSVKVEILEITDCDILVLNRVGGKLSSFSPTFVFRPLTPPYMRFRIRRFLFWIPFEIRIKQIWVARHFKIGSRGCQQIPQTANRERGTIRNKRARKIA